MRLAPHRVAAVGLAAAAMVFALPASVATGDPGTGNGIPAANGNDGHIQVDTSTLDPGMDNDPHVGCGFTIEFFGFDPTQLATITVIPWDPTTAPSGNPTLVYPAIPVTTNGNNPPPGQTFPGVGSTLDGWYLVPGSDLATFFTTNGVAPQPQQGYHVKLDVDLTGTPNTQGNDKYHTIWVAPCGTTTGSGETTTTTTTTTVPPTTTTTVRGSGGNGGPTDTTTTTMVGGSGGNGGPVTLASGGTTSVGGSSGNGVPVVAGTGSIGGSGGNGAPVVSATTVHTGMPWSGSRPYELGGLGAGLGLVVWGLELRRRSKGALRAR